MTRPARSTQNLFTPVAAPIAGNAGTDRSDTHNAMGLLRRFRALMQAARNQFVEARVQTGLTGAELWALAEVRRRPAIRVTELARSMSIHQTTASNLVMVLVRQRQADLELCVCCRCSERGRYRSAKYLDHSNLLMNLRVNPAI